MNSYLVIGKDLFLIDESKNFFILKNDRFFFQFSNRPKYKWNTLFSFEKHKSIISIGLLFENKFQAFRDFKKFYYLLQNRDPDIKITIDRNSYVYLETKFFKIGIVCENEWGESELSDSKLCEAKITPLKQPEIKQVTPRLNFDYYYALKSLITDKSYIDRINQQISSKRIDLTQVLPFWS